MRSFGKQAVGAVAAAVIVAGASVSAQAGPLGVLSAAWYTIAWGHADTEKTIDGLATGLVETALGPNGRPVRSALSTLFPPTSSNNIVDVDGATKEILWWSPGTRAGIGTVTVDSFYPNPVTLPFNVPSNLFPGGAGSNGNPNGYTAAHFFGTFDAGAGGTITIELGADDDAWVFINGQLVVDLGGVKGLTPAPTTITGLSPGTNRIDLFFADRHIVQSGLVFSADVTFKPIEVPEPASLAVLCLGLLGLALAWRRRAA